ncbi:MAG: biotin--[acetyl-CoA-carboxylase] ligase [Bacteroidales bacterium]|jgi:BirA family biotin operon repressor/biotin-[acetyl-CoA-carboxylase] ligase|nr:biotin--[acetyl-CoA-carboxylase] ligase [Bacteroidales bacterium]
MNIIRLQQTESTNRHLIQLSAGRHLPEETVVVADCQTEGRGQGSNAWESESGKNLTFSILLYPTFVKGAEQFGISKAVALAVCDFVAQYADSVTVKWPNDVYAGDRKITGILVENFMEGARVTKTIAGIGVNINQEQFVGDAPNPVSLYQITSRYFDLENCLHRILQRIADRYLQLRTTPETLHNDYIRRLYRFNEWKTYCADGERFEARIIGVNRYGMLELRTADNSIRTFGFKEVETIIP